MVKTKIEKAAFIGLGVMGYPMAGHLAKSGFSVMVYNRTKSKADRWVSEFCVKGDGDHRDLRR